MATYHVIGQPISRVDGAAKATGQARYAADVSLPGTLWGKSLHAGNPRHSVEWPMRQSRRPGVSCSAWRHENSTGLRQGSP